MIALRACLILPLLALASPAGAGAKEKDESWGKPDVSFAAYQADALACANRAYGVEVRMKPVGALGTGWAAVAVPPGVWTRLTPGEVPVYTSTFVEGYRHAARMDVVEQLQAVVDGCLVDRGYRKFRLTAAQMRALKGLRHGSAERAHYLHALGSTPSVLDAQAI